MKIISNFLIITGIILIIAGFIFKLVENKKFPLLPGDILIQRENFTFYFPIATSIIISIVLSLIFWLLRK